MKKIGWIVGIVLLGAMFACMANPPSLEPGPENMGLRLRLTVENPNPAGPEMHTIRIEVLNTGTRPVTLISEWPYEGSENYVAFLKSDVKFVSYPDLILSGPQTLGSVRTSPQSTKEIKPGEVVRLEYLSKENSIEYGDKRFYFPNPGLYGLHAEVDLHTENGSTLFLRSNEVAFIVGRKTSLPKYTLATLVSFDSKTHVARLNLGQKHGIEKGDQFDRVTPIKAYIGWVFTVTQADYNGSYAKADASKNLRKGSAPQTPEKGWKLRLLPQKM